MDIVYIKGIGYCREITIHRKNEDGVDEPYNIYEPIKIHQMV